jgi:hypothetical protein
MAHKATAAEDDDSTSVLDALSSVISQPGEFNPADHGLKLVDHFVKLQPGQTFGPAKYLGEGPEREFPDDENDGEIKKEKTHRFELNDGGTVILPGKAMLDSKLAGVKPGRVVAVQFASMGKGKRGQLGNCLLFGASGEKL